MNGRIYDPQHKQFLSPDPFIQAPLNTQSFNRYAYVLNNPMKYTDPSGYHWTDPPNDPNSNYYPRYQNGYYNDKKGNKPKSFNYKNGEWHGNNAVSYTHLTLPTKA